MAAWEPLKRCTFFLARFKTVGVKSEDGLGIKISIKTLSRDSRALFVVSLSVTRIRRLKVEKMHFRTGRQYYFPIFSVLVQFAKNGPRVPRYRCRAPVMKKTARI